ncbi:hypothetical protein C0J52_08802 [Blattella germanica]|nr:hypothetical protein C0J52_08802 [Blattella germanica]
MTSTQYKIQISELSKHLEQKENELTVVVFKYEQKLQEMKEKVNSLEADILKIQDRASRDVLLHKKKAMELEQEYKLLKQKQESTLLPQVRNTFEFAKVSQSSFRTPRTLPERPALQSILKKSSAYGSVMRKSLVSAPDDFSATATSTTDKMKETSEEIHSTSSSMPAEMSNKEALNTTFTMVENSHEEGSEPSREVIQSQTKKSKFTAARKRKLFRSNDLDMN